MFTVIVIVKKGLLFIAIKLELVAVIDLLIVNACRLTHVVLQDKYNEESKDSLLYIKSYVKISILALDKHKVLTLNCSIIFLREGRNHKK